jgi:UDP:flavonoid glycosyltransferase YjiC (YdhE family)
VNILLTPIGSSGDNFPFIGLGAELARRGHRVTVATSQHFEPLVRRFNLGYIQTGTDEEYSRAIADPDIWHPMKGFSMIMKYLGEMARRLYDVETAFVSEHGGDVTVVAHFLDFSSRVLQEKTGLPVVTIELSPTVLRTVYQMPTMTGRTNMSWLPRFAKRMGWWVVDKVLTDKYAGPIVNELRGRAGLAPIRGVFGDWLHSPLLTLGMWPDWFAPPQPDWPSQVKLTSFPLFDTADARPIPADVEAFLAAGEPPVVFTPGSANAHAGNFFSAGLEACRQINRRALFLTRFTDHLPSPLPVFAHHSPFAPLTKLLPRCAALVHHGGVGTTAAGLAGGVPQLIMPMSHDQPDNGARVKRLGASDRLLPKHFTAKRVAKVLHRLVESPDMKRRCVELADQLNRENGIGRACDLIEDVRIGSHETGPEAARQTVLQAEPLARGS